MIKVCEKIEKIMPDIDQRSVRLNLPSVIKEGMLVENWQEQCPRFSLNPVDKKTDLNGVRLLLRR